MQKSQREQDKLIDSSTRLQGAINYFSGGLVEDREYMKHCSVKEGSKMLDQLVTWMAEWVVKAQKTHFEASMVTINHNTSNWDSRFKGLKRMAAPAISGPIVLTDNQEDLFASLDIGADSGDQAGSSSTDGAAMKSPGRIIQLLMVQRLTSRLLTNFTC